MPGNIMFNDEIYLPKCIIPILLDELQLNQMRKRTNANSVKLNGKTYITSDFFTKMIAKDEQLPINVF